MNAVTSEAEGADTLKLLLEKGANPNAEMTEGERPLDWAIYKGDRAKIQVLEQYGAMRGRGPRRDEIAPPAPGGIGDARVSLSRSLSRLTEVAPKFRDQATCISCHHNAMPALAAATARRKGIEIDEVRAKKNLNDILTFFTSAVPRMMIGDPAVGGEAITTGYAQMALLAEGHPLDVTTGVDDALADGAADARRPMAWQRAQSSAVGIQPHHPHGDRGRWVEVVSASWSQERSRGQLAARAWLAAGGATEVGRGTRDAPHGPGMDRRLSRAGRRCDQSCSRPAGSGRRLVTVRSHATRCLRDGLVPLCAAHVLASRQPTTHTRRASHSCSAASIRMGRGW